jgi:hypothetical protein
VHPFMKARIYLYPILSRIPRPVAPLLRFKSEPPMFTTSACLSLHYSHLRSVQNPGLLMILEGKSHAPTLTIHTYIFTFVYIYIYIHIYICIDCILYIYIVYIVPTIYCHMLANLPTILTRIITDGHPTAGTESLPSRADGPRNTVDSCRSCWTWSVSPQGNFAWDSSWPTLGASAYGAPMSSGQRLCFFLGGKIMGNKTLKYPVTSID